MKVLTYLTLFSLLFFVGCNEVCDETCEPAGVLSDVEDMIAFIDPNQTEFEMATLYVREAHLQEVLSLLNATTIDFGVYEMEVELLDGGVETVSFTATFTATPFMFSTSLDPTELKSKYKVYVNAECEEGDDPKRFPCEEYEGEYRIFDFLGWDSCKKGEGICLEVEKIIWIEYFYEDSECDILTRIESLKRFDC